MASQYSRAYLIERWSQAFAKVTGRADTNDVPVDIMAALIQAAATEYTARGLSGYVTCDPPDTA